MIFGTHQRIAKIPRDLNVFFNHQRISITKTYKYLGVELTSTLNLNSQFNINYRKASARLKLLAKIRHQLTVQAAINVFNHMIVPLFSYCSLLKLSFSNTQLNMLKSIENRARAIVLKYDSTVSFSPKIRNAEKLKVCSFVHDVINNNVSYPFTEYFRLKSTKSHTRNNGYFIHVPNFKLEYGRASLKYQGAKIFNELPLDVRTKVRDKSFKSIIKDHYKF